MVKDINAEEYEQIKAKLIKEIIEEILEDIQSAKVSESS